jgi:hypothetical protein
VAPAEATRNPAKTTEIPTTRVTANPSISSRTEFRTPLALRTSVPPAIKRFDTSMRGLVRR